MNHAQRPQYADHMNDAIIWSPTGAKTGKTGDRRQSYFLPLGGFPGYKGSLTITAALDLGKNIVKIADLVHDHKRKLWRFADDDVQRHFDEWIEADKQRRVPDAALLIELPCSCFTFSAPGGDIDTDALENRNRLSSKFGFPDLPTADYWSVDGNNLVRNHVLPRQSLFMPLGFKDLPVHASVITENRTTVYCFAGDSRHKQLSDNWVNNVAPHRDLRQKWTGKTIFRLKSNVPVTSHMPSTVNRDLPPGGAKHKKSVRFALAHKSSAIAGLLPNRAPSVAPLLKGPAANSMFAAINNCSDVRPLLKNAEKTYLADIEKQHCAGKYEPNGHLGRLLRSVNKFSQCTDLPESGRKVLASYLVDGGKPHDWIEPMVDALSVAKEFNMPAEDAAYLMDYSTYAKHKKMCTAADSPHFPGCSAYYSDADGCSTEPSELDENDVVSLFAEVEEHLADATVLSNVDEVCYLVEDSLGLEIEADQLADLRKVDDPETKRKMLLAIISEFQGLGKLGTFDLSAEIPSDRKPISSRIVLRVKYRADGSYDKHKARLVARGFEAIPGLDFYSTFSPMAALTSVRLLLSTAVHENWSIQHADIPQAFCQAKLNTDMYLKLPQGIKFNSARNPRIVKLFKALYGLNSSPQLFNKMLNSILTDVSGLGFTRAHSDSCLYHYADEDGCCLLATEVDDLVITGNNLKKIAELRVVLTKHFGEIKQFEDISSFLGINIAYDQKAGVLSMDVEAKIKALIAHHKLEKSVVDSSEIPFKEKEFENLRDPSGPDLESISADDKYMMLNYRSIVGALIYISIAARPDVSLAVGKLSRAMHSPTYMHVRWLRRCLRYLVHHSGLDNNGAIFYRRSSCSASALFNKINDDGSPLSVVVGFADASYGPPHEKERKSITGFSFFAYGNLVLWKSKLQPIVAASTHECELIALAFAADEAVWLRRLLEEVGKVSTSPTQFISGLQTTGNASSSPPKFLPFLLYGDNKGSLFTATNPDVSHRSKHLDVRYYKIREYIRDELVDVKYVKTNRNVADFFTKGLEKIAFQFYRDIIFNTAPDISDEQVNLIQTKLFSNFSNTCPLFKHDLPDDVSSFFCSTSFGISTFLAG